VLEKLFLGSNQRTLINYFRRNVINLQKGKFQKSRTVVGINDKKKVVDSLQDMINNPGISSLDVKIWSDLTKDSKVDKILERNTELKGKP